MSTTPEVLTDLIGNLIYARCGWGDWAKRAKAARLPGWPLTFETAVALFETAESQAELTLAHWLTGRTWAKGSRVVEVMEAAQLSLAESPRYTSQLWRLLQKAKRHRDARHRLTQAQVDYLMRLVGPRRMSEWYKSLRMLRSYGTVRAD